VLYLWAVPCIVYVYPLSPFQSGSNGWGKKLVKGFALDSIHMTWWPLLTSGLAGKPSLGQAIRRIFPRNVMVQFD